MNKLEYADLEIGPKEVGYSICSMMVGLGVLTLPGQLVNATASSDGWLAIVFGGGAALLFSWTIAVLMARFPKRSYRDIAAILVHPGYANMVVLLFVLYMFLFVGLEIRGVSSISKLYLFDRTPVEAVSFTFLLVLVYGVAGPSVALLRLNLLYVPVVAFMIVMVLVMSVGDFSLHLLKPAGITPWTSVLGASQYTAFSFLGAEILLFYNRFINKPGRTVRAALLGTSAPIVVYLLVFVFVIGVFSAPVVANTLYPLAELAKQVEVPGGFFERFESVFFVVWAMSLYATAAMGYDVMLLALESVFPRMRRITLAFITAPLLFLSALQPQDVIEVRKLAEWVGYLGVGVAWLLPALLLIIAKLRGVKEDGN